MKDYYFGEKTFEQAEIKMQRKVIDNLLEKNNIEWEQLFDPSDEPPNPVQLHGDKPTSKFLDTNILIHDYLSGNYKITEDNKIISQTLIDKGFNYSKRTIEMANKTNESDEEETVESLKVDEQKFENKKEILTE